MKTKNYPSVTEAVRGWNLSRKIKNGSAARGRTEVVAEKPRARGRWEELKLRMRALRAAIHFASTQPVFDEPTADNNVFSGETFATGRLFATHIRDGQRTELGLICTKMVTTAGVGYIVDAFQNLVELENMKYHASGTGGGAPAVGDTALTTEVATRATGSTTEGASANIYRTVGTITYGSSFAIIEHGVFSASSGGVLIDRSDFSAINVISGDSIEFTYDLTFPAGG